MAISRKEAELRLIEAVLRPRPIPERRSPRAAWPGTYRDFHHETRQDDNAMITVNCYAWRSSFYSPSEDERNIEYPTVEAAEKALIAYGYERVPGKPGEWAANPDPGPGETGRVARVLVAGAGS